MIPGFNSGSGFFADCFLDLLVFFAGGGADFRSCKGLNGFDWLWELMMVSHMTAWDEGEVEDELEDGYVAVIQTNSCLVFQLKSDVKSKRCQH